MAGPSTWSWTATRPPRQTGFAVPLGAHDDRKHGRELEDAERHRPEEEAVLRHGEVPMPKPAAVARTWNIATSPGEARLHLRNEVGDVVLERALRELASTWNSATKAAVASTAEPVAEGQLGRSAQCLRH